MFQSVKVMGERSCATNFLAQMIHANFDTEIVPNPSNRTDAETELIQHIPESRRHPGRIRARIDDAHHLTQMAETAGWKHACLTDKVFEVYAAVASTLFVCILRHPALWIASFHKMTFDDANGQSEDLADFITTPWITMARDEIDEAILPGPSCLWNYKTRSYLDQANRRENVVIVRHEDLLREPKRALERLSRVLSRRGSGWRIPKKYARQWVQTNRDYDTIRAELPDKPFSTLPVELAAKVAEQCGYDTLVQAGYTDAP